MGVLTLEARILIDKIILNKIHLTSLVMIVHVVEISGRWPNLLLQFIQALPYHRLFYPKVTAKKVNLQKRIWILSLALPLSLFVAL